MCVLCNSSSINSTPSTPDTLLINVEFHFIGNFYFFVCVQGHFSFSSVVCVFWLYNFVLWIFPLKCVLCTKNVFFWNESNVQCLSVRGSNTKRKTICSQSEESLWFWNAPGTTYNWYLIWNKTRPFFNWANLETMISSKFDVSNKLWFFNLLRRSVFFVVVLIVSLVSFLFSVCIFSFGSKKRIFFHHLLKKNGSSHSPHHI